MRSTLISLGLVASAALGLFSAGAQANCVANPPTQSNSTFPASLTGKLAYHSYVSYGDGIGQSKLKIRASDEGTGRNINTVAKLVEMAAAR